MVRLGYVMYLANEAFGSDNSKCSFHVAQIRNGAQQGC